jgi:type I restriction enzyme S subunit
MRKMRDSGFGYIGLIPQAWSIGKLKQFFEKSNVTNRPDDTVLSLYRDYGVIPKDSRDDNHNVTSLDTSKYKHVDVGDFVINKMKGWQGSMALSPYEGIVSPAYHVFKFRNCELYPKYAHCLLRCRSFADEWHRLSTGLRVGQWDLHVEDFLNTCIPLPPLDEQHRIADYLDARCADIDAAVDAAESSIEEYKAYQRSITYEAVTGKNFGNKMTDSGVPWLRLIPSHWKVRNPKRLFAARKERAREDDVMLTASQHLGMVPQQQFMKKENYKPVLVELGHDILKHVEPGDFVISMRSFQGGLELSKYRGKMSSAYIAIRTTSPDVYGGYYRWLFKSAGYIQALRSTSNLVRDGQALRFANFVQVPVPLPPLDEQRRIADYLDAKCAEIQRAMAAKQSIVADLKAYKQSLIYEVVTGKREVR